MVNLSWSIIICIIEGPNTLIHPGNEISSGIFAPFSHGMLLSPYKAVFHIGAIVFQGQNQVGFGIDRCVALPQTCIDSEVFCHISTLISFR